MNNPARNKLLTALVVLLVIINAGTILLLWMGRGKQGPPPPQQPKEFLVKELNFDAAQQRQFDALVSEHRQAVEQLREQIKEKKDALFSLIKEPGTADSIKQAAADAVSRLTSQVDLITVNHFQKVRAICNAEQQKKFDAILKDLTRMIAQPRPPGDGPPGLPPPPRDQ